MAANKKKYASKCSAAARFMSTVHDDLLLEILIRLPRMGHAMTVCKSWHSLICRPDTFLRHTRHYHHRQQNGDPDPSYTPPCTLLCRYRPTSPCIRVLSEKSKILYAPLSRPSPRRNLLGFVLNLNSEAIKASFNDSLLIDLKGQYWICNPVTQEQRLLPNPPSANDPAPAKLMLVGSEESKGIFRFKVVKFLFPKWASSNTVEVFSSDTGLWNESELDLYPPDRKSWMVAAGRALYWVHGSSFIGVYDPFRPASDPSSWFIGFPFGGFSSNSTFRIGAVRGRFRVLHARFEENQIRLRIWELKNGNNDDEWGNDDDWSLVRQVLLAETNKLIGLVGFHPEDEELIFVSNGYKIFRFELKAKRFTKVGQVPAYEFGPLDSASVYFFIEPCSLVHHSV